MSRYVESGSLAQARGGLEWTSKVPGHSRTVTGVCGCNAGYPEVSSAVLVHTLGLYLPPRGQTSFRPLQDVDPHTTCPSISSQHITSGRADLALSAEVSFIRVHANAPRLCMPSPCSTTSRLALESALIRVASTPVSLSSAPPFPPGPPRSGTPYDRSILHRPGRSLPEPLGPLTRATVRFNPLCNLTWPPLLIPQSSVWAIASLSLEAKAPLYFYGHHKDRVKRPTQRLLAKLAQRHAPPTRSESREAITGRKLAETPPRTSPAISVSRG